MSNTDLGTISAGLELQLSQFRRNRTEAINGIGDIGKALTRMADEAEKAGDRTDAATKRAIDEKAIRAQTKALNDQKKALAEVASLRKQWGDKATKGVEVAFVGLTGVLAAATKQAMDFDKAMRNVNSIARLSEKRFQELRKDVLALTKDPAIVDGPQALAEGLNDVYSAGFEGRKALDILEVSAKGATAGLTKTKVAADVLTSALNSNVKGATDAKVVMDVLFQSVNDGKQSFEDLAGSLGAVLPTASQAGVSIQELGAAIAVMTAKGQTASEASNDLLNLITKLVNPSTEASKAFDQLGIKYGFTALQASGLEGKIEEIRKKTNGHADAIKELLPDMQAQRALLSLLTDGNLKFSDALNNAKRASDGAGSTQKALSEQMKSAAFQAQKAMQEIQALAVEIGTHLLPVVRDLLRPVRDITKAFSELDPETQKNIVKFASLTLGIGFVISKVAGLIGAIKELQLILAATKIPGWLAGAGGSTAGILGGAAVGLGGVLYGAARESIAGSERQAKEFEKPTALTMRQQGAQRRAQARVLVRYIEAEDANKDFIPRSQHEIDALNAAGINTNTSYDEFGNKPSISSARGGRKNATDRIAALMAEWNKLEATATKIEKSLERPGFDAVNAIIMNSGKNPPPKPGAGTNPLKKQAKTKLTEAQKRALKLAEDKAAAIVQARQNDVGHLVDDFDTLFDDYKGKAYVKPREGESSTDPNKMTNFVGKRQNTALIALSKKIMAAAIDAANEQWKKDKAERPDQAAEVQFEALQQAWKSHAERLKRITQKDSEQGLGLKSDSRAAEIQNLQTDIARIEADLADPEVRAQLNMPASERSDLRGDWEHHFAERRRKRRKIAGLSLAEDAQSANQDGSGMEEARARYQSSLDEAEREYAEALRGLSETQRDEAQKRLEFELATNVISKDDYRERLAAMLGAERQYSERWMKLKQQLHEWDLKQAEASKEQAKDAAEERLRIMALEVQTGKRTLESYRDELKKLLSLATPYSKEWEALFKLLKDVETQLAKAKGTHDKDATKSGPQEGGFNPMRGFKEALAQELGDSIAQFTTFENFLSSWKQRVRRLIMDLVGEIVTNWARVQLGLPDGSGKGKGGSNEKSGKSGDNALDAAALIPGAAPVVSAIKTVGKIFGFANGGMLRPGLPALVGETGGEFIVPRVPSLAIPAQMLDEIASRSVSLMGGGSGGGLVVAEGAIQVHINGNAGPADFATLADQLAWHLAQRFPAVGTGSVFGGN